MPTFTKDSLPAPSEFRLYRKVVLTRMAGPFDPPVIVETEEGDVVSLHQPAYLALDPEDNPYLVKASVAKGSYERADTPTPNGP